MHLADRHQRDFSLWAASAAAGIGDLFPNEREVLSQRHPGSILFAICKVLTLNANPRICRKADSSVP